MSNLKVRCIRVLLELDKSVFNDTGSNVKEIIATSLYGSINIDVKLKERPLVTGNTCEITIYGMKLEDCFSATKFNSVYMSLYNKVSVFAGYLPEDTDFNSDNLDQVVRDEIPLVYNGVISHAGVDLNNKNRPFSISSVMWAGNSVTILPPTNISTSTKIETVIRNLVNNNNNTNTDLQYQLFFTQGDREIKINEANYTGDFVEQLKHICNDYGYTFLISNNNLYVTPIGEPTNVKETITISKETGLLGYPVVMPLLFKCKIWFNPNVLVYQRVYLDTYYKPLNNTPGSPNRGNNNDTYYLVAEKNSTLTTNNKFWETDLSIVELRN